MYKDIKEKAKELRAILKKEMGVNAKQVSVKSSCCGYSDKLDIKIKDLTVNKNKVEELANTFDKVDRCEASGEILQGGNTYVFVEFDWETVSEAKDEFIGVANEVIEKCKSDQDIGFTISTKDDMQLIYWPNSQWGTITIYTPDRRINERKQENCSEALAKSIAILKAQYGFEEIKAV